MQCSRSVDIDASAAKIWGYLSDFANWTTLTSRSSVISRQTMDFAVAEGSVPGPGMRLVMTGQKGFTQVWTADEWENLKRMRLTVTETRFPFTHYRAEIAFTITPKTSLTTQVDMSFTLESLSAFLTIVQTLFRFEKNLGDFVGTILARLQAAVSA